MEGTGAAAAATRTVPAGCSPLGAALHMGSFTLWLVAPCLERRTAKAAVHWGRGRLAEVPAGVRAACRPEAAQSAISAMRNKDFIFNI